MLPNHEIIPVAGDGLCILQAYKECVKARGDEINLSDIKLNLKAEMSDAFYETLLTKVKVKEQTEQFLWNPLTSFNNDVSNMFLALKIKIYQFNLRECWVTDLSNVQKGFDTMLYFVTILSVHIDAIIPKK